MSVSRLTPNEKTQAKLTKWLALNVRKQEAIQHALEIVKPSHRSPLKSVLKDLEAKHVTKTEQLNYIVNELAWEVAIVRPLMLHIEELGAAWADQSYSHTALNHLRRLKILGDKLYHAYTEEKSPEAYVKEAEDLMDKAPLSLGRATLPSPFYPEATMRHNLSDQMWAVALKEMTPKLNGKRYQEGVTQLSCYLDMFEEIATGSAALLEGNMRKIHDAMDANVVSGDQMEALDEFIEYIENKDEPYEEDKKAKRAFLQSAKLQKSTQIVKQPSKSRRL